jgi:hypothetical protein
MLQHKEIKGFGWPIAAQTHFPFTGGGPNRRIKNGQELTSPPIKKLERQPD